jgi:ubiquinone/menaquinone biosynthesis C-methylase UbiE
MEPDAYVEMYHVETDHWWYRGMRQITERMLLPALSPRRGLRILDAGCGTGGNLGFLKAYGTVHGLDYSMLALSFAKRMHLGAVLQATVEHLPFPDGCFDLVTSFDVLYHQEVGDEQHALSELARVLRPNGVAFVRLPALAALRGAHDAKVHGARRYTLPELRTKLSAVGLRPLRLTYANTVLLPVAWLSRWISQLSSQQAAESDLKLPPTIINKLLTAILALESRWLGSGRSLPLGVSVIGLAIKPD